MSPEDGVEFHLCGPKQIRCEPKRGRSAFKHLPRINLFALCLGHWFSCSTMATEASMERLRGNPARHRRGSTRLTSAVIYNFSSFFIPDGHQSTESFVQILFFPPWLPWTDTTTKRNGLPLGAPRRQLETMSSLNLPNFFFFFSTRHSSAGAL